MPDCCHCYPVIIPRGTNLAGSNGSAVELTRVPPFILLTHLPLPPGSKSSGSNRSNSESNRRALNREKDRKSAGSGSESDHTARSGGGGSISRHERPPSQLSHRSYVSTTPSERSPHSHHSYGPPGVPPLYTLPKLGSKVYGTSGPPGGPPVRELGSVPPELTGSRQSFQKAMGNPCEFFVDIM